VSFPILRHMVKRYSQSRAALAIARGSFLAMIKSPTSVVFSILFPIIFIIVFGSIGDPADLIIKVAIDPHADTSNLIYHSLVRIKIVQIENYKDTGEMETALKRGRLTAILNFRQNSPVPFLPHYDIQVKTSASSANRAPILVSLINDIIVSANKKLFPKNLTSGDITINHLPGRIYRVIDFILPGQLGFSMLMAGVFSSAFLFFNLRQTLVLKRFFATPITRPWLIAGEMLSRLFFQILGFIIIVGLGYWIFDFTLVNGFFTFVEMLLFSIFGLVIFMGIGFIVSGHVENEGSIAPLANTVTLPQILLCGLFFSIQSYPSWLQSFCNILPLTILVDGLRKIAFEGLHIWQIPWQLFGIICWTAVVGIITIRTFRWE
jgi:ABC-2 type transport system permease protein